MNKNSNRNGLVVAVNSTIALGFLQGQLEYFQKKGFDVNVFCPERRKDEWEVARPIGIPVINIPMERAISPLKDMVSLWRLWRAMRKLSPAITNVGTPKAGLLGGLAAWLNRVPCRFYTLHGLRFETSKGWKRRLLVSAERLACRFAHRVVCVSWSVREEAIACGLSSRERTVVLGSGSCNGIDASRFAPTTEVQKRAADLRRQLNIPKNAPVAIFVGRLTKDKGIPELIEAFLRIEKRFSEFRLVLAGCFENEDPLPARTRRLLQSHPRIIFTGAVHDTPAYYAMADIVVLPSHREGLPTVVLEAQAAGKPVIGASATGIVDVITHGVTGLLFPVGDVWALAKALTTLIDDEVLAAKLGLAGQLQVRRNFQQLRVWEALHREYSAIIEPRMTPSSDQPFANGRGGLVPRSNE
jgi:glycosyltransferase involved in cell wall biosynthesis